MKTETIAVLSLAAGIAVGGAAPLWQRWTMAGTDLSRPVEPERATLDQRIGPRPIAEVDATEFRFGTIAVGATRSHVFTITNRGDAPLEIHKGSTSCKCTISDFEEGSLAPGESARIKLEWTARTSEGDFREIATILTNDPTHRRIDLSVVGRVTRTVQVEPNSVVFSRLRTDQEKTAHVKLLCFVDEPLRMIDTKLEMRSPENAKYFDVSVAPLSPEDLGDPDAKSGLDVRITVRPGMPVGTFRGLLHLTTNVKDQGIFMLRVAGSVVSDVSVLGPGWSHEQGILTLGKVSGSEGIERRLFLHIRGRDARQVDLGPVDVDPQCLQVTLGEAEPLPGGRMVRVPLSVRIPPGTHPINRLGTDQAPLGEIVVHTNHPRAREIRLLVRFVVE